MSDERPQITDVQRSAADAAIRYAMENPRSSRPTAAEQRADETERDKLLGAQALERLRALACKKTGLTLEQFLAEEAKATLSSPPVPKLDPPIELRRHRARLADMPERYRTCVIDREPLQCKALEAVKKFLGSRRKFLMLNGGSGTFKSGSSCWSIGQLDGSRFVYGPELVRTCIEKKDKYAGLLNARLLVFDDLAREKRDGSWNTFLGAFDELFERAYTRGTKLILTANTSWAAFAKENEAGGYGKRLADRFEEDGTWFNVPGESQRLALRDHWSDREPGADDE